MHVGESINAAAIALEAAERVVCVSHRRPDGDTLGAMLTMAKALEAAGKHVSRFCIDQIPQSLMFLTGSALVTNNISVFNDADTIAVFDAGDLRFACIDEVVAKLTQKKTIINIDHHATNEMFGDINCNVTDAASTTDVVHRILRTLHWRISPEMATALLCGLVTDTGLFFNPATSAHALHLAAELQSIGGDLKTVARSHHKNKTTEALVLWGKALERLKYDHERSHVSTAIRAEELAGFPASDDSADGLANFLNSTLDARTVLVLKELPDGMVKGSLRTAREDVDVAAEALKHGGGGHRKAAGYTTKARIVEREKEWAIETNP